MKIDIPTLNLILFLISLGNLGLSLLVAWSGRKFRGAWLWVLGQSCLVFGSLLLVLWTRLPVWVGAVFGNGFFLAASVLFAHSVWIFRFRRRFPQFVYALAVLAIGSLALMVNGPSSVRIVIFSFWAFLGAGFVGALLVWRPGRSANQLAHFGIANCVTAAPFFLVSLASLLRLFFNLVTHPGAFLQPSVPNVIYLLGSIFVPSATLFGYFMMARFRFEAEVREKDNEIEERNRQLLELSRSKDLFFSIIAHDLRGPIGGAARYVRKHLLGKMTGLESKFLEVETLAAALDKTNEFLEKLLWWSRAQLRDWVPSLQRVNLDPILHQTVELLAPSAELKKISIELPEGPFVEAWADAESVQLILGNLVSNAVKFSFPSHVVQLEVVESEDHCRISVIDHGVGMDQASLERLFHIEAKLTTHGTSGERGSGLGLLLAQSLARRNGGDIVIESQVGVGTRATLVLCLPPAQPSAG